MSDLSSRLHELYRSAFERAERERRWSVFEDVPWERGRAAVPSNVVSSAETFFCMHAALPEFVATALMAARSGPMPTGYIAAWAYEKSRHQLALSEWLVRAGHRTQDELCALELCTRSAPAQVPFTTGRQLIFYGAIQEMASFVTYAKHRELARAAGDECLRTIYDFAARDEIAHARFFEAATRLYLEDDRAGTLDDMSAVVERFVTPGELLLSDYEERMSAVREAGIDRGVFIQRVYSPLLRKLGVTRRDLTLARASCDKTRSTRAGGADAAEVSVA